MSSGVSVEDECIATYQDLKMKHAYRYIIYKMSEDSTRIVVAECGKSEKTYDEFTKQLPENDCRYAVFDLEYTTQGMTKQKICLFVWAPDTAPVRQKMLYASSKDALKKKLVGFAKEIQCTDHEELELENVLSQLA
jgi:cofilin